MVKPKRYLLGFWVLCGVIFFQLLSLTVLYFATRRLIHDNVYALKINIINAYQIMLVAILFLEAMTYWSLRNNIVNRQWVKAHVWLVFFAMVVIPFFTWFLLFITARYLGMHQFSVLKIWVVRARLYISWSVFIIAHVFFILTLVNFFKAKSQHVQSETTADVLEEFSE
jgi:hypothetical protein